MRRLSVTRAFRFHVVPSSATNANIARYLSLMAEQQPGRAAIKVPHGRTLSGDIDYLSLTFSELSSEVDAWRMRLAQAGVRKGDRTLVMVKPGLPLIAGAFALFQLGAVPVIIDPGMGLKNFLQCVARTRPRVLLGIPFAHFAGRLFRTSFRSVEVRIAASRSLTARQPPVAATTVPAIVASDSRDLAAILFTSGSTGAPKGVCYEHGMFEAQVNLIRSTYGIAPGEVDLPLLPIFALFNPALGMTSIIPEIDPRRPAKVDPAKIVRAIQQENVTNSFGSPTLWKIIGDHCRVKKINLPTLRRVLCAGAPVPAALWAQSKQWLPHGELQSPYGATEALPISSVSASEIDPASVQGACVGRPLAGIDIKIIRIDDAPIHSLDDAHSLPPGELGEIIVSGPVVTKQYDALPEATAAAKIVATPIAAESAVWHRMGDCGYFDADGRIWFCGRKAERVETVDGPMHTEPCEQVFRSHPRVTRCALIGVGPRGKQTPAMVIESKPSAGLVRELRALARCHPHTAMIEAFYFRPDFPVDVRHNAKIHRLVLTRWAATAPVYRADSLS